MAARLLVLLVDEGAAARGVEAHRCGNVRFVEGYGEIHLGVLSAAQVELVLQCAGGETERVGHVRLPRHLAVLQEVGDGAVGKLGGAEAVGSRQGDDGLVTVHPYRVAIEPDLVNRRHSTAHVERLPRRVHLEGPNGQEQLDVLVIVAVILEAVGGVQRRGTRLVRSRRR